MFTALQNKKQNKKDRARKFKLKLLVFIHKMKDDY